MCDACHNYSLLQQGQEQSILYDAIAKTLGQKDLVYCKYIQRTAAFSDSMRQHCIGSYWPGRRSLSKPLSVSLFLSLYLPLSISPSLSLSFSISRARSLYSLSLSFCPSLSPLSRSLLPPPSPLLHDPPSLSYFRCALLSSN